MNNALYPGAIEANREGRFSMAQAGGLTGVLLLGAFLLLLGAAGVFITLSEFSFFNFAVSLLFLWLGYRYAGEIVIDMARGSVLQTEGKGKRSYARSGRSIIHYYVIGEQRLHVPSGLLFSKLEKLDNVEHLHAYYLPRSKVLVNLEW